MANPGFASFQPGDTVPASRVEITVSARNLLDMDTFSKSDPMCVMYTQSAGTKQFIEYGRTEVIWNTLNPDFVKKFTIDYFFEERQELKFELYDIDSNSRDLRKHDFIGGVQVSLGEIFGSGGKLEKNLTMKRGPAKNCGRIILKAEELSDCRDLVTMQFKGQKLDKKDFFGKSDPFLVFYRCNEDGSYTICHKTEVIKNTLNPTWKPFNVMVRALCNGDYERTIKIECYDWDRDGGHDLIGEFTTSVRQLSAGSGASNHYECINPKKKSKKKNYKHSGMISLLFCKIEQQHSFLEFIQGGLQLSFTVAIDFTASNGNPSQPTSLHYMNPYQPNHYERALRSVGEIIQDYDTDKLFPALGFGAKIPPDTRVHHEFFLNMNPSNPYCTGIGGIMDAYKRSLHSTVLYGPTLFAPVVNHVARFAAAKQDGTEYFILLIITDGCICDMAQTKEAIVAAATLPMSIIIVGVGKEDFSAMEELDGDEVRLSSNGRLAERDIVQFVPFRDFENESNVVMSQARLAKEVLAEIPDQIVEWMKKRNIKPKPPTYQYTMRQQSMPSAPVVQHPSQIYR